MKHLRIILLVVLVLALATLACGLGRRGAATQTEVPPEAVESSAAQPTPAPTEVVVEQEATVPPTAMPIPEATPTPAESPEAGGEEVSLDLAASMSSLENLNSYRATWRFDWSGTKDDQPVDGHMQMNSAFVREPAAQELHFEGQGFEAGDDQGLGKVSFIQVGDTAWFYESQSDTWMQVPAGSLDFAEGLFFQPEDLLSDFNIDEARRSPSPEEVNGVQAYKYAFDETDFDLSELAEGDEVKRAEGEIYVAADGNYVVKLVIDADMRFGDPDQMFQEGNIKMAFDISDVNQPITIEPPAEAEAQTGREDIPILPDADMEFASAEFISYRTATGVKDAAQFYQDEMPKNGWTADETNMVLDESAILNYNKEGETANIIVSTDEEITSVLVSITKE